MFRFHAAWKDHCLSKALIAIRCLGLETFLCGKTVSPLTAPSTSSLRLHESHRITSYDHHWAGNNRPYAWAFNIQVRVSSMSLLEESSLVGGW